MRQVSASRTFKSSASTKSQDGAVKFALIEQTMLVERLLSCEDTADFFRQPPFSLTEHAAPKTLDAAFKRAGKLVHPDKCQHPQATEAFQRLAHSVPQRLPGVTCSRCSVTNVKNAAPSPSAVQICCLFAKAVALDVATRVTLALWTCPRKARLAISIASRAFGWNRTLRCTSRWTIRKGAGDLVPSNACAPGQRGDCVSHVRTHAIARHAQQHDNIHMHACACACAYLCMCMCMYGENRKAGSI